MVTQQEIRMRGHRGLRHGLKVEIFTRNIRFFDGLAINVYLAVDDSDAIARNPDHAFYVAFGWVERRMEDNDVATFNRLELVDQFVDENALLVLQSRQHTGPFHSNGLIQKENKKCGQPERYQE